MASNSRDARKFLVERWELHGAQHRAKRDRRKNIGAQSDDSDDSDDLGALESAGSRDSKESFFSTSSFPRRHKKSRRKREGYKSESEVNMAHLRSDMRRDMHAMMRNIVSPEVLPEHRIYSGGRAPVPSYQTMPTLNQVS